MKAHPGDDATKKSLGDREPSINKFFSGRRFPFATLSSMDDQMFFLGPSLLDGRLLFPDIVSNIDPAQPAQTI